MRDIQLAADIGLQRTVQWFDSPSVRVMKRYSLAPIVVLLAVVAGCTDSPGAADEPTKPTLAVVPAGPDDVTGLEREFASLAQATPAFAGFYRDQSGTLVVRLVGEHPDPAAAAEVFGHVQARGRRVEQVRVLPARFRFSELRGWRESIRANLPSGVYSLDLDEVENVLSLGVSEPRVAAEVHALAARLGMPPGAVQTYIASQPQPRATLTSQQRPVRGGLQIWVTQLGTPCTITIGGLSPTAQPGVFTASHCSWIYAATDPPTQDFDYYQPTKSLLYYFGEEQNDPVAFAGGSCAAGRVCRWADILFVRIPTAAWNGGNTIFKPSGSPVAGGRGSTTIAGTFTAAGGPPPVVGDSLQKVGRTSGWTKGALQSTCVDKWSGSVNAQNQQIWILCNDVTSVWSEGGDSGSPIFWNVSGSNVTFAGILWGGPSNNFNETWFSPCANIAQDLPSYQIAC